MSDVEKVSYTKHIETCQYCLKQMDDYNNTVRLVDSVSDRSFSDSFWKAQRLSICEAAGLGGYSEGWIAPRYLLVLMLTMVGIYAIDGIGFLYASIPYGESVISYIRQFKISQFFDMSFLVYGMFILIGLRSFVCEDVSQRASISREM